MSGLAVLWDQRRQLIDVEIPLCGSYCFSAVTGKGRGLADGWILPEAEIRRVRDDPGFKVSNAVKRPKPARGSHARPVQANDRRQRELPFL
jgi:hypothetical protein